ncbi:MAG: molybdopterin synthase catalytic subunit [bacterium]|nr:MAG: molybdopterin synthase catalytic subunit [bacterium]
MALDVRLIAGPLSAPAELEAFLAGRTGDGAVVSFIGLARGVARDGSVVDALRLDWYPGLTEGSMHDIAAAAAARFPVRDLVVAHRCGDIVPGETIVFVAAAAAHRRAAFEAADYRRILEARDRPRRRPLDRARGRGSRRRGALEG